MAALAPGTTMDGTVSAGPGVSCQNAIFAIVCYGPPGSTASLAVEVALGSFELPPTRCSGGAWTDYTIDQHTASSARAPSSVRGKQSTSCGTATHTLTVTAPPTPYSYDFKGAYATFTACWDYLPNPCATMTSAIARLGIVTERVASGGGPTPAPTNAPGDGSSGSGSGGSCGSSTLRLPASLRRPRTGVIGGDGSPPPTVEPTTAPTETPSPTPSPSPTPTATPLPCASDSPTPDLQLDMEGSLVTPQYAANAPSYNYDDSAVVALEQANNGGVGTASSARRASATIELPCAGTTTIGAATQATMTVHVDVRCLSPAIVTKIDGRLRRLGFNHQTTAIGTPQTPSQACGASTCTANFSFQTIGSGLYEASATFTGSSGQETKTSQRFLRIVPFNDRGTAYPQFADSRFPSQLVPFPSARTPFLKCPPNLTKDQFGCYARDPKFADNLKQQYLAANWDRTIFKYSDIDAHHIHPLQWGGDNSVFDNGVFLIQYVHHSAFDPWWSSITIPD